MSQLTAQGYSDHDGGRSPIVGGTGQGEAWREEAGPLATYLPKSGLGRAQSGFQATFLVLRTSEAGEGSIPDSIPTPSSLESSLIPSQL